METIRWIGRLLIWPFIVLLDVTSDYFGEWYVFRAGIAVASSLALLGLALVALFVPLWPFPSSLANTIIFCFSVTGYLVIGVTFYFEHRQSGRWQRNGPW